MLGWPDLPGLVLVASGLTAWFYRRRADRSRWLRLLLALVLAVAGLLLTHRVLHMLRVSHAWLDPLYAAAFVLYCLAALTTLLRQGPR